MQNVGGVEPPTPALAAWDYIEPDGYSQNNPWVLNAGFGTTGLFYVEFMYKAQGETIYLFEPINSEQTLGVRLTNDSVIIDGTAYGESLNDDYVHRLLIYKQKIYLDDRLLTTTTKNAIYGYVGGQSIIDGSVRIYNIRCCPKDTHYKYMRGENTQYYNMTVPINAINWRGHYNYDIKYVDHLQFVRDSGARIIMPNTQNMYQAGFELKVRKAYGSNILWSDYYEEYDEYLYYYKKHIFNVNECKCSGYGQYTYTASNAGSVGQNIVITYNGNFYKNGTALTKGSITSNRKINPTETEIEQAEDGYNDHWGVIYGSGEYYYWIKNWYKDIKGNPRTLLPAARHYLCDFRDDGYFVDSVTGERFLCDKFLMVNDEPLPSIIYEEAPIVPDNITLGSAIHFYCPYLDTSYYQSPAYNFKTGDYVEIKISNMNSLTSYDNSGIYCPGLAYSYVVNTTQLRTSWTVKMYGDTEYKYYYLSNGVNKTGGVMSDQNNIPFKIQNISCDIEYIKIYTVDGSLKQAYYPAKNNTTGDIGWYDSVIHTIFTFNRNPNRGTPPSFVE